MPPGTPPRPGHSHVPHGFCSRLACGTITSRRRNIITANRGRRTHGVERPRGIYQCRLPRAVCAAGTAMKNQRRPLTPFSTSAEGGGTPPWGRGIWPQALRLLSWPRLVPSSLQTRYTWKPAARPGLCYPHSRGPPRCQTTGRGSPKAASPLGSDPLLTVDPREPSLTMSLKATVDFVPVFIHEAVVCQG